MGSPHGPPVSEGFFWTFLCGRTSPKKNFRSVVPFSGQAFFRPFWNRPLSDVWVPTSLDRPPWASSVRRFFGPFLCVKVFFGPFLCGRTSQKNLRSAAEEFFGSKVRFIFLFFCIQDIKL